MVITLDSLLKGNATLIKNKEYLSTNDYVSPFIDEMSKYTDQFNVKVKLADQLAVNDDSTNIIYNRVLIEAVLPPENCVDNHDEVVGFVYGLDIRKPVAKLYRGYLNQACINLSVFNAEWIQYQEIEPQKSLKYPVKPLLEMANGFPKILDKMKKTFIDKDKVYDDLGRWVDFTLRQSHNNGLHSTKLSPSIPIDAYKLLFLTEESPYFVPEDQECSLFNVHGAFTQIITDDDKDIMNKFEKTLLIDKLLNISGK